MDTKVCSACKQELPFPDSFYSNGTKKSKGNYSSACKECSKQRARERYKKNQYKETRDNYKKRNRDTQLVRARQRMQEIQNHKDPDLIPYPKWRDAITSLKEEKGLSWRDVIRITGISNIENQVRGRSWPPDIDEAHEAIEALREISHKRVDLDKWIKTCEDIQKKFGLSQAELERKMWLSPGLITRQKRGDKPPPTKENAERALRRAYGLAVQLTERERRQLKTTVVHLPGGEQYVRLDRSS